jgi:hypothetical protein
MSLIFQRAFDREIAGRKPTFTVLGRDNRKITDSI